jgi:hypothetical protein
VTCPPAVSAPKIGAVTQKFIPPRDQGISHINSDDTLPLHLTAVRFRRISSRACGLAELRPQRFQAFFVRFRPVFRVSRVA